jgi:hypothetical protein
MELLRVSRIVERSSAGATDRVVLRRFSPSAPGQAATTAAIDVRAMFMFHHSPPMLLWIPATHGARTTGRLFGGQVLRAPVFRSMKHSSAAVRHPPIGSVRLRSRPSGTRLESPAFP